VVTAGKVVDEIVRIANEQHADLILLRARSLRGWRHVFRSTIANRVRRKALIPVITLDNDDFLRGGDVKRRGVPAQRLARAGAVSSEVELVGAGVRGSHVDPGTHRSTN
jgi:hypothetical protein